MKLNRNSKIRIRISRLVENTDIKVLSSLNKALAETDAALPTIENTDLTFEQKEYLLMLNKRIEELRFIMNES
ncbi:MAG: hypothetical protein ACK4GL_00895 [Flavobacteriales bacterium]